MTSRTVFVALLLCLATSVLGGEVEHRQLAKKLDQQAVNQELEAANIVRLAIEETPAYAEYRDDMLRQLREYVNRPAVVDARIQMYMQYFSESQIQHLIKELARPLPDLSPDEQFKLRNPFFAKLIHFMPNLPNSKCCDVKPND